MVSLQINDDIDEFIEAYSKVMADPKVRDQDKERLEKLLTILYDEVAAYIDRYGTYSN